MGEQHLDTLIQSWAEFLERKGLAELCVPFLDLLEVWGVVGAQALHMLAPFTRSAPLTSLAGVLEDPESMRQLRQSLLDRREEAS
ncbi:MAG: hypothetical protein ACP5GX_03755 [Anaerolineae bacterium]